MSDVTNEGSLLSSEGNRANLCGRGGTAQGETSPTRAILEIGSTPWSSLRTTRELFGGVYAANPDSFLSLLFQAAESRPSRLQAWSPASIVSLPRTKSYLNPSILKRYVFILQKIFNYSSIFSLFIFSLLN
jgi:hypothetical protein